MNKAMTSREPTSSSNLGLLPPALAELVQRPKRLSAQRLWGALEKNEKSAALATFTRTPEDRRKLVRVVAAARNFRENTITHWDNSKIVQWAQPLKLENWLAGSLLHAMHVERRREMLAQFLNAIGIPNQDGVPVEDDEQFGRRDPGDSVVHAAANDLVVEHGLRRVVVYFLTLASQRVPFEAHLGVGWTSSPSQRELIPKRTSRQ